jgi:regulator of sigma E protease
MMEDDLVAGDYEMLSDALQDEDGLNITILRDGEQIDVFVVPEFDDANSRYKIGVGVSNRYPRERVSIGQAVVEGTKEVFSMTKMLIVFLGKLIFTGEGAKDVGSIVGAVVIMNDVAQQMDLYYFLYILAFISVNLGIFNLLPIPPFDGFRVVMYLFEGIRGKKIAFETQMKIQFAGFVLLFGLSILLIYRDVVKIIAGG